MPTMNNNVSISRAIEGEAATRAAACRREMEQRRANAAKLCPEALRIEKEINSVALELSSKIMSSPDDAPALNALAADLIAHKRSELACALKAAGLPEDWLEPVHVCAECRDTGYSKGGICRCMRQVIINSRFSGSGLDPSESFESFRFDLLTDKKQQRAMRKIYDFCQSYADSFPDNQVGDLLLMGVPGVGKTYLLNCIGGRVLSRGRSVLKITASKLIETVLDTMRDPVSERPDFSLPELLIIDDLGTEKMINNVTIESLLSMICERQDAHRPTLYATNLGVDVLSARYGSRISSRLIAPRMVRVISVETDNVRLKQ